MFARFADGHVGDRFYDPLEICLTDGGRFRIRRRVTEIDRNRNAIANGELNRVQIIAEISIQRQHALLDLL